jgi:DNA-directed RNA polymerase subunit M/transcription elongation factor TFIIS
MVRDMFYFKGCDKCKGDLHLEEDSYGSFLKCIQCGRMKELQARAPGMPVADAGRVKTLAA